MAHGNNHAKQIVIDQANCLAEKLENGHSSCVKTQGRAIGLLVKMITPLYKAEFVTVEDCKQSHDRMQTDKKITKIKIGPVAIEGPLTTAIILQSGPVLVCGFVIFLVGKIQSWW